MSFSAAALGAETVIITDVDSAVNSLTVGAQLNGFQAPRVKVTALDWTDRSESIRHIREELLPPSSSLDYLLASDVIWVDFLVPSLVDTIADWMQIPTLRRDSLVDRDNIDDPSTGPSNQLGTDYRHGKSPILLLAYQFRSTRSDELLFGSLDQLGLQRKKVALDRVDDKDEDAVELDPKFRRPNLCIWKIWKS